MAGRLADAHAGSRGRRRGDVLRYAKWRLESGERCDLQSLLVAAARASEAFDTGLAERLARAAMANDASFDAALALNDALFRQGRFEECVELLDQVQGTTDRERTQIGVAHATLWFWVFNKPKQAQRSLRELSEQTIDTNCQLLIAATLGRMQSESGHVTKAAAIARSVLEKATDPRIIWNAKETLGPALAMMGSADEAIALATDCIDPAARPDLDVAVNIEWPASTMFLAALFGGYLSLAGTVADAIYKTSLELGHTQLRVIGATSTAAVALARGDIAQSCKLYTEAASWPMLTDVEGLRAACLGGLTMACALSGKLEQAREALALGEETSHRVVTWFRPTLDLGRAWIAAATGETSKALGILEAAADLVGHRGQYGFEVWLLLDAARLGGADDVAFRLQELRGLTSGPLCAVAAHYAVAKSARDPAGLEDASVALETLGMLPAAAEAAGDAATFHRAAGRRSTAAAAALRCRSLQARCAGLGAWLLASSEDHGLTRREYEVARMVAGGLANREVASRLRVSTRTIETHLERVYTKIGVHDRSQLASWLG